MAVDPNDLEYAVSRFGTWYEYAHQGRNPNIDTLHAPTQPTVDYIQFTGVAVTLTYKGDLVFRRLIPARREYREQVGTGATPATRAGWHDVEPAEERIDEALAEAEAFAATLQPTRSH